MNVEPKTRSLFFVPDGQVQCPLRAMGAMAPGVCVDAQEQDSCFCPNASQALKMLEDLCSDPDPSEAARVAADQARIDLLRPRHAQFAGAQRDEDKFAGPALRLLNEKRRARGMPPLPDPDQPGYVRPVVEEDPMRCPGLPGKPCPHNGRVVKELGRCGACDLQQRLRSIDDEASAPPPQERRKEPAPRSALALRNERRKDAEQPRARAPEPRPVRAEPRSAAPEPVTPGRFCAGATYKGEHKPCTQSPTGAARKLRSNSKGDRCTSCGLIHGVVDCPGCRMPAHIAEGETVCGRCRYREVAFQQAQPAAETPLAAEPQAATTADAAVEPQVEPVAESTVETSTQESTPMHDQVGTPTAAPSNTDDELARERRRAEDLERQLAEAQDLAAKNTAALREERDAVLDELKSAVQQLDAQRAKVADLERRLSEAQRTAAAPVQPERMTLAELARCVAEWKGRRREIEQAQREFAEALTIAEAA